MLSELFGVKSFSASGQLKTERFEEVNEQIGYLFKLVQRFEELKLSSMEYAYLKLISFTANGLFICFSAPDGMDFWMKQNGFLKLLFQDYL